MIDSLISLVASVLGWIIGKVADAAGFFSDVAYYAGKIPAVGGYLRNLFTGIQEVFNDLGYDFAQFSSRLQDALNAIDDWLDKLPGITPEGIFAWIMSYLGISKKTGETWIKAATRVVVGWISSVPFPSVDSFFTWLLSPLGISRRTGETWIEAVTREVVSWISEVPFPSVNSFFSWLLSPLGITRRTGETWIQAITRTVVSWISSIPFPSVNDFFGWLLSPLGITRSSGESWWDAIMRTVVSSIPGLAGIVNFWNFFFEDLNDFFTDPAEYFLKKLETLGLSFAERMLDVIERILEKVW